MAIARALINQPLLVLAAVADRLLSMRDGSIVEDTRLDGGLSRQAALAQIAGWEA